MSTILIKNAHIATMTSKILHGDILIRNDIIEDIAQEIKNVHADKTINATGKIVMPGFVNAHTHVGMSLFRGMLAEARGEEKQKIYEVEEKLTRDDIYNSARLSILEMIKSGTTTFCDSFSYEEEVAKAINELGVRGVISRCVCGNVEQSKQRLKEAEELYKNYNEKADGRIKVVLSLDDAQNSPPEAIRNTVELAKRLEVPVHMHYLGNKNEIKTIKEKYNKSVTEYLKSNNLFDVKTVLSHAVWADELDLSELQFHDVSIVSTPRSNSLLGNGLADVKFLLEGGINVALGTGGQERCNTLDMFEEIRQCAYSQKILYKDMHAIRAEKCLELATIKGAKALGMAKEIGTIEKGKKADLIIVNINQSKALPIHNAYTMLAYQINGEDVDTTIVNGKILMEGRKLLVAEEGNIIESAKRSFERLFSK